MTIVRPELIANFEHDQREHGTETAIHNLVYVLAVEMLSAVGVVNVKTKLREPE